MQNIIHINEMEICYKQDRVSPSKRLKLVQQIKSAEDQIKRMLDELSEADREQIKRELRIIL